jgi:hypothetical protein
VIVYRLLVADISGGNCRLLLGDLWIGRPAGHRHAGQRVAEMHIAAWLGALCRGGRLIGAER